MASGYMLVDHPNPNTPQGGLPRRGVSRPSGTCILHTSEGAWTGGVDALTSFVRRRTDYGCYHRACDWEDIALYYPWEWETWQDSETNPWAVGIAAACRTSDWAIMPANILEGYYRNMARMAADFVTYMRTTHGIHVPLKRITGAQARARVPGFCAHGDSGIARTDPGANFDWAKFFRYTAEVLGGAAIGGIIPAAGNITPAPKPKPKEWDEMATKEEIKQSIREVLDEPATKKNLGRAVWHWATRAWNGAVSMESRLTGIDAAINDPKNSRLRDSLRGLDVNAAEVSAVDIAAAIPEALAADVADELAARLKG